LSCFNQGLMTLRSGPILRWILASSTVHAEVDLRRAFKRQFWVGICNMYAKFIQGVKSVQTDGRVGKETAGTDLCMLWEVLSLTASGIGHLKVRCMRFSISAVGNVHRRTILSLYNF